MKVLVGLLTMLLTACGQSSGPVVNNPTVSGPTIARTSGSPTASTPAVEVLPAAQAYVDAVARRDLDGLVNAFHPDGRIVDVSRTIAGHDAIRTWAGNEVIGGTLEVLEIVERRPDGQKLLVRWAPAGSDGWRAHYDFTVRGDRISVANLQYA
jgi:SnoaL-like domain